MVILFYFKSSCHIKQGYDKQDIDVCYMFSKSLSRVEE